MNSRFRIAGSIGTQVLRAQTIPGLSTPMPPALSTPVARGLFIDRIPEVMRIVMRRANTDASIGRSTPPDQFMDYWRRNSEAAITDDKDLRKAEWARYVIDVEELRAWKFSKKFRNWPMDWVLNALDPKQEGFQSFAKRVWLNALSQIVGTQGKQSIQIPFPHPAIPTEPGPINELFTNPDRNDKAWFNTLYEWAIAWEGDGQLELDPTDPFSLCVGRFGWMCIPAGYLEVVYRLPELPVLVLNVTHMGIFAVDKYDFTNDPFHGIEYWDQPLGEWNVDDGCEGVRAISLPEALLHSPSLIADPHYYPPMGWCYLTNKVFERYRLHTKRGRDFLVLSNVKYMPFSQSQTFYSWDFGGTWNWP